VQPGSPSAAALSAIAFRRVADACTLVAQVKSIAEMGAYVSLLEYNNIEGMILLSELSRRRIRSVTKLIKARSVPPRCAAVCINSSSRVRTFALALAA